MANQGTSYLITVPDSTKCHTITALQSNKSTRLSFTHWFEHLPSAYYVPGTGLATEDRYGLQSSRDRQTWEISVSDVKTAVLIPRTCATAAKEELVPSWGWRRVENRCTFTSTSLVQHQSQGLRQQFLKTKPQEAYVNWVWDFPRNPGWLTWSYGLGSFLVFGGLA